MGRKLFALLLVGLFVYISSPLLLAVAMGAVFAVLFFPWLEKLEHRKLSTGLAAALLTVGVTLLFLVPATMLVFLGAKTGFSQLKVWREAPRGGSGSFFENLLNTPGIHGVFEKLSTWFPVGTQDLINAAEDLSRAVGVKVADLFGDFLTQLPGLAMGMAVMVISIYFFLVDGRRLVLLVRRNSVFNPVQTEQLIHAFAGMCRSVIMATVISGFAQSVVFGLACLFLGVAQMPLIAFLVFLGSFVPLVGSAPVTFGVGIYHLFSAGSGPGIALLVMAGITSVVDNLIRPMVLKGGAANLHPLLAFVAAFGGIQVLGFLGVFIGPIIAAMVVVTVQSLLQGEDKKPA